MQCTGVLDRDQGVGTMDHQDAWERGTRGRRHGDKKNPKKIFGELQRQSLFSSCICVVRSTGYRSTKFRAECLLGALRGLSAGSGV